MNKRNLLRTSVFLLSAAAVLSAPALALESGRARVLVIKDPYTDSRTGPEKRTGPDRLFDGGLPAVLERAGCAAGGVFEVKMPDELEREYGEWNRASLTNHVINTHIAGFEQGDVLFLGLLAGSKSLTGMLAGLQHIGPGRRPLRDAAGREVKGLVRLGAGRPLRVGLVWISARGDFHTPDITIEGDMGGMNVAMAAGLCLTDLRLQAGLDPPLAPRYIVMAGLQDSDAYERHHIDSRMIETLSVEEIRGRSDAMRHQMDRISRLTEIIYVHVDLSVLDPDEIPGGRRVMPGGPTSRELASCLEMIFENPHAAALGIASLPDDAPETAVAAAHRLIEGAAAGFAGRTAGAARNASASPGGPAREFGLKEGGL